MQIIRDLNFIKKPIEKSVVTIGNFDGVHIGHQRVIKKAVACAKKTGGKSVVVTFDSHPKKVINNGHGNILITSTAHKISLIMGLGVDICVLLDFNRRLAVLSAEDFVKKVLAGKLAAKQIFVGFNFLFGHNKSGNTALLEKLSGKYGYKLTVVKPVVKKKIVISSTAIRKLICAGKLRLASDLLGRRYSIYGTVVYGHGFGHILGFPTANIRPFNEVIPPTGVYAVKILYSGKLYDGVLNIGCRPTFRHSKTGEIVIEAHLFNFSGDLYGKMIEIFFTRKIREERKFFCKEDLVRQIKKDTSAAKKILKNENLPSAPKRFAMG